MFLQNLRAKMSARLSGDREAGFTLIELLVVMLILGILAAIAIPAFFNQRDKATDAQAKAAVRTAQTAIETYATENNGSYAAADPDKLIAIEETLVKVGDNAITVPVAEADKYTVTSTSADARAFTIKRVGGVVTFECAPAGGGCPSDLDWSD